MEIPTYSFQPSKSTYNTVTRGSMFLCPDSHVFCRNGGSRTFMRGQWYAETKKKKDNIEGPIKLNRCGHSSHAP